MTDLPPLDAAVLPDGVRAQFVDGIKGIRKHILEAGHETTGRPLVLLLHGFPELAYSWRKIIPPLAASGFHVVAPDQRGYGRTTGWDPDYDGDLASFRMLNLARDALGLIAALGHASAAAVIGHDFGASVAAWCALTRPDVFRSLALMAPFGGPPPLPESAASPAPLRSGPEDIHAALAALPRPRKHYQWYYSTRPANDHMWHCPQGVHAFLRAYVHMKSADWPGNRPLPPRRLDGRRARQDAGLLHHGFGQDDGRAGRGGNAVRGRDRRLRLAHRAGARGLQRRIRAHRVSGRAAMVSLPHPRNHAVGTGIVRRPNVTGSPDDHAASRVALETTGSAVAHD